MKRYRNQSLFMEPGIEEKQQDRISRLPECIISHIQSFLPTKSSFATSFLAKDWKLRWTKVSTLRFDDLSWPNHEESEVGPGYLNFVEFVNKVFITHTGFIEKLLLYYQSENVQPIYLHIWVEAAVARNLVLDLYDDLTDLTDEEYNDEIDRRIMVEDFYVLLPDALYTCRTLEVLKLQGSYLVVLPHVVCLPKLQELELNYVKIDCEFVEKLISACPVLHSLLIQTVPCFEGDVGNLKISSPSLKRLEVQFSYMVQVIFDPSWKLVIDTPAVEFLVLNGSMINDISCIQDRLPVNELDIGVGCNYSNPLNADSVARFVQACDDVKIMRVGSSVMVALDPKKPNIGLSATFQKLTKLTASFYPRSWCCLLDLIDRSVNLEVLELMSDGFDPRSPLELGCNRIPACLSSSLKHLDLWEFGPCVTQMALLKLILKQGLLMETVTLRSSKIIRPSHDEERLNMLNEVLMLPRASATCKITFSLQ